MPDLIRLDPADYMDIAPPTQFLTNEFTYVFQQITETYGIPKYKEMNPSLFGCVTFPFLFGVMFGDICHGGCLFIVGALLCLFKERLSKGLSEKSPVNGLL
jgi:V-type H+-transporting ATPase subunit a